MQRRAAAGYVTLFLVLAAGAYVLITVTAAPTVTVESPDHELGAGDEFAVDGRTYTVRTLDAEVEEGDGHGSGGGVAYTGTVAWTNDSARYTVSWPAGDEVAFDEVDFLGARLNGSYTVVVPDEADPTTATLRAVPEDVETGERGNVTFVVIEREDGTIRQVPIGQYEPLQRVTLSEGTVDYLGNRTAVSIDDEGVTLSWTAPRTETVDLEHTRNVTLDGQRFFVYYEGGAGDGEVSALLTTDTSGYRQRVAEADRYHGRENGLWGITILGGSASVLLTALAFLPRKDV
jgi:hypothetical protein